MAAAYLKRIYSWIYRVLLVSTLRVPENKQWNIQKLSLNNFATVHYATIQHLFLVLVCSYAADSAENVTAIFSEKSTCQ